MEALVFAVDVAVMVLLVYWSAGCDGGTGLFRYTRRPPDA
jgi:hypothetical protein